MLLWLLGQTARDSLGYLCLFCFFWTAAATYSKRTSKSPKDSNIAVMLFMCSLHMLWTERLSLDVVMISSQQPGNLHNTSPK